MELTPCPACRRHVLPRDAACPFCGAAVAHDRAPFPAQFRGTRAQFWIAAAALVGCTKNADSASPVTSEQAAAKPSASVTSAATESAVASAAPSASSSASPLSSSSSLGLAGTGMAGGYGAPPGPGVGLVGIGALTKSASGDAIVGSVAGAADVPDSESVVARNRWRFKACYVKALAADPEAQGTIKLEMNVGPGGEVVASSLASDAPAGLTTCIVSAAGAMKFAPPTTGKARLVTTVRLAKK